LSSSWARMYIVELNLIKFIQHFKSFMYNQGFVDYWYITEFLILKSLVLDQLWHMYYCSWLWHMTFCYLGASLVLFVIMTCQGCFEGTFICDYGPSPRIHCLIAMGGIVLITLESNGKKDKVWFMFIKLKIHEAMWLEMRFL
jgi:hypothetical protein